MASREPSAAPSSGGDTIDDQPEDVKPSIADLDNEDSAVAGTPTSIRGIKRGRGSGARKPRAKKNMFIHEAPGEGTEDEGATPSRTKKSGSPDLDSKTQGTAVGTRRQANGIVGSVYSGNKVRHIKQPDGTPLWRKEIQYEFLRGVVEDTTPVFTRISDGKKDCNFADIYIDCMARSSKTSKVLKERLHIDRQAAQNMAMICLLVNVGRMNTTLNFFPEMRAQLRTYHSIPSLQAYKSQKDYKSLQDAPRLKSILKGASEDTEEPRSLLAIKAAPVPRTNPVNLIFVLSQHAPEIAHLHFTDKVDFFDLAIRSTISSKTRATAFLWLMWWYLESNYDRQSALNNPFGTGEFKETQDPNDPNEIPQLVPRLEFITEEEGDAENIDPEEEKSFAERMTKERKRIMAEVASGEFDQKEIEHKGVKRLKKSAREVDDDSDADSLRASPGATGRSPATMEGGVMGSFMAGHISGAADSGDDGMDAHDLHPGRGRYKRVKGKNTPSRSKNRASDVPSRLSGRGRASGLAFDRGTPDTIDRNRGTPQPAPPGSNHPVLSQFSRRQDLDGGATATKSRARTGYQRQLEEHKNSRIEWLLKKKRRDLLKEARKRRKKDDWLIRTAKRINDLDPTYDSEEDENSLTFGMGNPLATLNGGSSASLGYNAGVSGLVARRVIQHSTKQEGDEESNEAKSVNGLGGEEDDYGEEAESWLKVLKRAKRRIETWSGEKDYDIYIERTTGKKPSSAIARAAKAERAIVPMIPSVSGRGGAGTPTSARRTGRGSSRGGRKSAGRASSRQIEMSLNDEITQDLLAERSEDEGEEGEDDDRDVMMEDENTARDIEEDSDMDVD